MSHGFISRYPNYADWLTFNNQRHPPKNCISNFATTDLKPCSFGNEENDIKILAVGDSHMNQWVNALKEISTENTLNITLASKSACAIPKVNYDYKALVREYTECTVWRENLISFINQHQPKMLIIQNSSMGYVRDSGVTLEEWGKGLHSFLQEINTEIQVTWILDNPSYPLKNIKCVDKTMLGASSDNTCFTPRENAISADIQTIERRVLNNFGARALDFTEDFCDESFCFGIINGIPVMADSNHISQHFIQSLKPKLIHHIKSERIDFK